jgi:hypothetical protein
MELVVEAKRNGRKPSCICGACLRCKARAAVNKHRAAHPDKAKEQRRQWYADAAPEQRLLMAARSRARKKGRAFTLTLNDIHIPEFRPVLGVRLELEARTRHARPNSPSLDRIEAHLGYVPGNVWVISHRANVIKSTGTPEEHRRVAAAVEAQTARKPRFSINPFV